jgi:hypothetical protein
MRVFGFATCLASFVAVKPAAAAPLGATITVERSERANDCPDAPALTQQVERILQRSLAAPSESDQLEVHVQFAYGKDEYYADVHSLGAKPGVRSLRDRGASCSALSEAVSVAIALLLDKELEQRVSGSESEHSSAPAARPQPLGHAPASAEREASSSASASGSGAAFALRASLEGGAASGLVGQTSPLLSEQVGVRVERSLLFDAGFSAVLPGTTQFDAHSVRTTLLFGSARACYLWGQTVSVGPCAAFGIGRLQGVGIGYPEAASQNLTWTAFAAGLVLEAPVWGRVFWDATGSVWLPTHRSSFSVQNAGTAWESSPAAATIALRLGFRIF